MRQEYKDCCPICMKPYNLRSRQQKMICLNQHCICSSCADEIAENEAKCPFCKKFFDVKEIQPRRISKSCYNRQKLFSEKVDNMKKGLCPQQHLSGSFLIISNIYCNKCGQKRQLEFPYWKCNICRYIICCLCTEKVNHQDICTQGNWIYDQIRDMCYKCGKFEICGRTCQICKIRIGIKHD